jgi:hypothetical protein
LSASTAVVAAAARLLLHLPLSLLLSFVLVLKDALVAMWSLRQSGERGENGRREGQDRQARACPTVRWARRGIQ